jgi:hypothetical protein
MNEALARPAVKARGVSKTSAKASYCLSDKDLSGLAYTEKKNPVCKTAAPMRIYNEEDVKAVAITKHGSLDGLAAVADKRAAARFKRAQNTGSGERPSKRVAYDTGAQSSTLLSSRTRVLRQLDIEATACTHVVYWMQTAVRAHDNPALTAAAKRAQELSVPLIVVALCMPHRWATARRWMFLLQGLRDVGRELESTPHRMVVFMDRTHAFPQRLAPSPQDWQAPSCGDGLKLLSSLCATAALLVTEDMPVHPHQTDLGELIRLLPSSACEVQAVDTACIVPMRVTSRAYERAYEFRQATGAARTAALNNLRDFQKAMVVPFSKAAEQEGPLPISVAVSEALQALNTVPSIHNASDNDILSLVAQCPGCDHSISPSTAFTGGFVAGNKRWVEFASSGQGLRLYASNRNNILKPSSVSRMSAYHHFGMGCLAE